MGIAGHHGYRVCIHGKNNGFQSQSAAGQSRFTSGVSRTDDTDILTDMIFHTYKFTPVFLLSETEPGEDLLYEIVLHRFSGDLSQ